MKSSLTREEADRMLLAEKLVTVPVTWAAKGSKRWTLDVEVFIPEWDEKLRLHGQVGRTNYSFALLYKNYPLRKYTKHAPHLIGGQVFSEPHKHVWDGYSENEEAYIPGDIDPNADINDQFLAFCSECRISFRSHYQRAIFLQNPSG
jgi:hypothetical protein